MSAKSSIKALVPAGAEGKLFQWVAVLTGSKNALKGIGFFMGGVLLATLGFAGAMWAMAGVLLVVWIASLISLKSDLGKAKNKPKFGEIFSSSRAVNILSAARMFLFGARDVWFVVALPVFMATTLGWADWAVGTFFACWVIGYGIVQSLAPYLTGKKSGKVPDGRAAMLWAIPLAVLTAGIAMGINLDNGVEAILVGGLLLFGVLFAVNSSLHSYLIVSYAKEDGASLDVGFYYMANAMGRLIGTVLSGWVYQTAGLAACLWISATFIALAAFISIWLPRHKYRSSEL